MTLWKHNFVPPPQLPSFGKTGNKIFISESWNCVLQSKYNVDFKYVYAVVLNSSLTGTFSDFLLWSKTHTLLATTTVSLNNTRIGNHSTSRSTKWSRSLTSLLEIDVLAIRTLNLWIWSVLTASYLHSRPISKCSAELGKLISKSEVSFHEYVLLTEKLSNKQQSLV